MWLFDAHVVWMFKQILLWGCEMCEVRLRLLWIMSQAVYGDFCPFRLLLIFKRAFFKNINSWNDCREQMSGILTCDELLYLINIELENCSWTVSSVKINGGWFFPDGGFSWDIDQSERRFQTQPWISRTQQILTL